jgi:hypothetical protein
MRIFRLFLLITFYLAGASCNRSKPVFISVESDSVINFMQGGIGLNFSNLTDSLPVVTLSHQYRSYGGSSWGANPSLKDSVAWNKIFRYADWMAPDFCRVLISMHEYQAEKGKFTFDNYSMRVIYKYLDFCQSRNIDVFLQQMWNNVKWLAVKDAGSDPLRILRSAPNNIEDYTESIVKLLDYLINVKHYSCIKYICIVNEPFADWSWYIGSFSPDKFASPEPAYALLKSKLLERNLPVKLSGPDVSVYYKSEIYPQNCDFFKYFDSYDVHSYVTRYDWYPDSFMTFEDGNRGDLDKISLTEKQYGQWKQYGKKNGNKPVFLSEMGTFMYGFAEDTNGMSSYNAMLKDVESVIRYTNVGVDGFMRWSFLNRGNLDGQWQFVNTWDIKNNRFLTSENIVPQSVPFYTWGLLSRYVPKHAVIIRTNVSDAKEANVQRVFSAFYKAPGSNNWSLFIVNDGEKEYQCKLMQIPQNKSLIKIQVVPSLFGNKLNGEITLPESKFRSDENLLLPSKSITLISTYNISSKGTGIYVD